MSSKGIIPFDILAAMAALACAAYLSGSADMMGYAWGIVIYALVKLWRGRV